MKLKLLAFFSLAFVFLNISIVNASGIENLSLVVVDNGGNHRYFECAPLYNPENNHLMYVLDPLASTYYESKYFYEIEEAPNDIELDDFKRINMYAYFGYGYQGRTDVKWYAITQYLIYEVLLGEERVYFSLDYGRTKYDVYEKEITELKDEVSTYLNDLATTDYEMNINEVFEVPKKYYSISNMDENVKENTDYYEIKVGQTNLDYQLISGQENYFKIVTSNRSSYARYLENNGLPLLQKNINIISLFSNLHIKFNSNKDENTTIDGKTIFGLYDENDNLVKQLMVPFDNDEIIINYLARMNYKVKMISNSFNVRHDDKVYSVDLSNDSKDLEIYLNYLRSKVIINLHDNKNNSLDNVKIKLISGNKNYSAWTDKNGNAMLWLEPGTYEVTALIDDNKYKSFLTRTINFYSQEDKYNFKFESELRTFKVKIYTNKDTEVWLDKDYCIYTSDGIGEFITTFGYHEIHAKDIEGYDLDVHNVSFDLTGDTSTYFVYTSKDNLSTEEIFIPNTGRNCNLWPLLLIESLVFSFVYKKFSVWR